MCEWSEASIAAERARTPGAAHVAHFNNAGSSLLTQEVLDATINYLRAEATMGG